MECRQARELFSEYIDKRLDSKTSAPLNEHLAECAECRVHAARLERMNKLFAAMPTAEPPLGFHTRVLTHVREQAAKPKLWSWLSLPFQIGVPMQATAVVLVAALAVFLYQQESPPEQLPTTPVPMPAPESAALAPKSEPASASPPVELARKADSGAAPKLSLRAAKEGPTPTFKQHPATPPADAPPLGTRPAPAPSGARPFGAPGAPNLENRESARAGEATADLRLTLRLNVQLSMRKEEASADSARPVFASLTEDQAKRLDQARQRALETGQAQNATLSLPRDKYEQLKQELRAIGVLDPEAARQAPPLAKDAGSVSIQLTLLPPGAR